LALQPISDMFLAETPVIAIGESGDPETKKLTSTVPRIPAVELELTYMHNPIVFNSINKTVQTIMSAKYELTCPDKKTLAYFNTFLANLGNSGAQVSWDELLSIIFKQQCIYGKAFVENIYNKKHNRIVDWDFIDPKTMDYAKNADGKIVVDKWGNPVGYFQSLPYGSVPFNEQQNNQKLPPNVVPPKTVSWIYLPAEIIAQIKMYIVGSGFYPLGLIEPIYKNSLRKMNMEDAAANAAYRKGFPIYWAQLGDLNHEPTPNQINSMLDKLKNLTNKSEISTPYYYQLHMLESKGADKIEEQLKYYTAQEIAGMGIPVFIATGGSESANRATIAKQDALYQLTLQDIIRMTTTAIEKYMFKPICELEGFKVCPKIKWDVLSGSDALDAKARRLLKYVDAGILSPDMKISEFIKRSENLE